MPGPKGPDALRTIGEVSEEIGRPAHILRYWEKRFPLLRPLQRAGNRRYYRLDDVALVKRIDRLLSQEGYTIDGAARALAEGGGVEDGGVEDGPAVQAPAIDILPDLRAIRNRLQAALDHA